MTDNNEQFRVLSPTAILGYGFPESSFIKGMSKKPHLIAVDAGSTDPGPYYLGAGKPFTDRAFVKRDLEYMLKASVKNKIPVVIGTAGGSGAKPHLDWCKEIVYEIVKEQQLTLKLGIIESDVDKQTVLKAINENRIKPLQSVPELTIQDVEQTTNLVAQLGIEEIQEALKQNCDVILVGRCYDPSVFAALPIMKGFDPGLALHMGKILECAAIAATPGSGSDCALGTLYKDCFVLEPLSDKRKFTCESAAAHTLYEKSDPYHLPGPGGEINLEKCVFEDAGDGKVKVSGSKFEKTDNFYIKLEGAKPTGYRSISIAGTRDPIMIADIDNILDQVKQQIYEMNSNDEQKIELFFHVYGKNGVMGPLEPKQDTQSHELCIIIEALCPDKQKADTLCSIARSTLLHYGYEGRISTAGNLAFPFSPSDISMGEVYEFSVYHLLDPDQEKLFEIKTENIQNGELV